jgi:amino acid transporter
VTGPGGASPAGGRPSPDGAPPPGPAGGPAPVRHLGRLRLVAVGINSVVGGGIFVLPAVVTARVGAAGLLAYLAAGALVLGVGLSLGRLAARFERSGGPYLYVQQAFGGLLGFQAGWLFTLARLSAMASLLNACALYLGQIAPGGGGLPARALFVGAAAAFVIGTNIAGIRGTSGATNVLAVAKTAPLVLLGVAGLFFVDAARFEVQPPGALPFVRSALLLVFAFTGFEILTVPAEESLRPRRDMPAALLATVLSVGALYLLVHAAALGMLPDLGRETAPLARAAGILAGPAGLYAMTAVAAVSTAGCSLASLLGGSRMLYAMAVTGQIPASIGALHPARRTPARATLLIGAPAAVLAVFQSYETLSAVSAGTRLLVYLACCLACLRRAAPGNGMAGSGAAGSGGAGPEAAAAGAPGGRTVAALTAAGIVVLLLALELREVLGGMIGVGIGMVLYLAARRSRAAAAARGGGS